MRAVKVISKGFWGGKTWEPGEIINDFHDEPATWVIGIDEEASVKPNTTMFPPAIPEKKKKVVTENKVDKTLKVNTSSAS